jgi:hypothetical protein
MPPTPPTYSTEECRLLRQYTEIDVNPINPDKDIQPTGKYELVNDTELPWIKADSAEPVTYIYMPSGKLVGRLATQRVKWLARQYQHTKTSFPALHEEEQATYLAADVANLYNRYKDGFKEGADRTELANHWALPDAYMHALQQGLSINQERFASPLNVNLKTETYWSLYSEDRLFGANHNAYSSPFSGASEANPEYIGAHMHKAVSWAVASANWTQEPVLTTMVLPDWDHTGTSYLKFMQLPNVHILTRVPRANFKFKKPNHYEGDDIYAKNPKWAVNFIVIANRAGLGRYVRKNLLSSLMLAASREVGQYDIKLTWPGSFASTSTKQPLHIKCGALERF